MNEQIEFYRRKLNFEMDPSDLFQAINEAQAILPIDCRQPFGFEREHIPSAINIPHMEMNEESTKKLDKTVTYACYCDGIGCNASTKGALKMSQLGFKVIELMGGIEWWKFDGYATEGKKAKKGALIQCAC